MAYINDLLISDIYNSGEAGLAMGKIPPGKGGSPGQPYDPPKEDPKNPYVPAPGRNLVSTPQDGRTPTRPFYNRPYDKPDLFIKDKQMIQDSKDRFKGLTGIDLANLADGQPDASIMNYVTENGFFLDGQGKAYMQTGGKLYDAGGYNPDIHGLPVPLAQQMQINQDVANITPKDFSPPPFRYMPHIRIPSIKEAEMQHMKNFIEAMGGSTKGLTKRNKTNDMMIAGIVGYPHSNVQIDTGEDITTGKTYKRVLPDYGAGRIKFPVRPKKL